MKHVFWSDVDVGRQRALVKGLLRKADSALRSAASANKAGNHGLARRNLRNAIARLAAVNHLGWEAAGHMQRLTLEAAICGLETT